MTQVSKLGIMDSDRLWIIFLFKSLAVLWYNRRIIFHFKDFMNAPNSVDINSQSLLQSYNLDFYAESTILEPRVANSSNNFSKNASFLTIAQCKMATNTLVSHRKYDIDTIAKYILRYMDKSNRSLATKMLSHGRIERSQLDRYTNVIRYYKNALYKIIARQITILKGSEDIVQQLFPRFRSCFRSCFKSGVDLELLRQKVADPTTHLISTAKALNFSPKIVAIAIRCIVTLFLIHKKAIPNPLKTPIQQLVKESATVQIDLQDRNWFSKALNEIQRPLVTNRDNKNMKSSILRSSIMRVVDRILATPLCEDDVIATHCKVSIAKVTRYRESLYAIFFKEIYFSKNTRPLNYAFKVLYPKYGADDFERVRSYVVQHPKHKLLKASKELRLPIPIISALKRAILYLVLQCRGDIKSSINIANLVYPNKTKIDLSDPNWFFKARSISSEK